MDAFTLVWSISVLAIMAMTIAISIKYTARSPIEKRAAQVTGSVFAIVSMVAMVLSYSAHFQLMNLHFENGTIPKGYEMHYKDWKVQQYRKTLKIGGSE